MSNPNVSTTPGSSMSPLFPHHPTFTRFHWQELISDLQVPIGGPSCFQVAPNRSSLFCIFVVSCGMSSQKRVSVKDSSLYSYPRLLTIGLALNPIIFAQMRQYVMIPCLQEKLTSVPRLGVDLHAIPLFSLLGELLLGSVIRK